MSRVHNFGAGPGVLPATVLEAAKPALWDLAGSGIGIMEHSHRGKLFEQIVHEAESDCRELASIPDSYDVLFLQGGASLQFAMVPLNLLPPGTTADYLITGVWSQKALKEASIIGNTHVAASGEGCGFNTIPEPGTHRYSAAPAYVHVTTNNTIYGTQWQSIPEPPAGVPLVADASSDIFSRVIEIEKYGLIYAGAQKNLGPSGVTLVIIRKDLLSVAPQSVPGILKYQTHAKEHSLYNTPPTFGIFILGLVLKWLKSLGGLPAVQSRNEAKAKLLYDCLNRSAFYQTKVTPESRSLMNVCFRTATEELDARFVKEAEAAGLAGLKGHRSAGGMRASIYNACEPSSVQALVDFMTEFERRNG